MGKEDKVIYVKIHWKRSSVHSVTWRHLLLWQILFSTSICLFVMLVALKSNSFTKDWHEQALLDGHWKGLAAERKNMSFLLCWKTLPFLQMRSFVKIRHFLSASYRVSGAFAQSELNCFTTEMYLYPFLKGRKSNLTTVTHFFPEQYNALLFTVWEWEEMKADLPRNSGLLI